MSIALIHLDYPREGAGGLSREYVLRVVNGDLMGRRYIALVADTA